MSPAIEEPLFLSATEMGKARQNIRRWLALRAISLAKGFLPESTAAVSETAERPHITGMSFSSQERARKVRYQPLISLN